MPTRRPPAEPTGTPAYSLCLAVNTTPRDGKGQPAMVIDVISFGVLAEAVAEHSG